MLLGIYMGGMCLGSLLLPRYLNRSWHPLRVYAALEAGIGVFGVISYGVSQRTQEIGVRVALGADQRDVVRLIVRHGAALAGAGLVIGLAGALAATRLLATLLYQVSPTDPPTFLLGATVLGASALAAAALPAARAARLDPAVALRAE